VVGDAPGQAKQRAARRDEAALDLGDAEAGLAGGDDQVARERDLEAARAAAMPVATAPFTALRASGRLIVTISTRSRVSVRSLRRSCLDSYRFAVERV
jgi:hypothetical protein